MKQKLNTQDMNFVTEFNIKYKAIVDTINRAMQFKMDDYLILYVSDHNGSMVVQKNSYGAPTKFKVIYITDENVAFVKKVNKKGNPVGRIYSCVGIEADDYRYMSQTFRFEIDPDFADSILLDNKYDPANLHRSKRDIWKAVTEHNKACKIKTHHIKDVISFYATVNVGDTLWTSNISYFLVQDKKNISPKVFNNDASYRHQTSIRDPFIPVLTVKDKSGKVKDISPDFFRGKALYKERPRTYKELNI